VQGEAEVRAEWFEDAEVVGLTAGTSTPDDVIERVEGRILSQHSRARSRMEGTMLE
jgi:4-hydroxy-3-methylbut-2-enyl diphosphate reductase